MSRADQPLLEFTLVFSIASCATVEKPMTAIPGETGIYSDSDQIAQSEAPWNNPALHVFGRMEDLKFQYIRPKQRTPFERGTIRFLDPMHVNGVSDEDIRRSALALSPESYSLLIQKLEERQLESATSMIIRAGVSFCVRSMMDVGKSQNSWPEWPHPSMPKFPYLAMSLEKIHEIQSIED